MHWKWIVPITNGLMNILITFSQLVLCSKVTALPILLLIDFPFCSLEVWMSWQYHWTLCQKDVRNLIYPSSNLQCMPSYLYEPMYSQWLTKGLYSFCYSQSFVQIVMCVCDWCFVKVGDVAFESSFQHTWHCSRLHGWFSPLSLAFYIIFLLS